MERFKKKTRITPALIAAMFVVMSGCGGNDGGPDPVPATDTAADTRPDPFVFTPQSLGAVKAGSSIEATAQLSGFEGMLKATFNTTGPITAELRAGKNSKPAKSVDVRAGTTIFVKVTVAKDAVVDKNFELTLVVGESSGSLKGVVGDGSAPSLTISFPSQTSISTLPKTSVAGHVEDAASVESIRIKELPGERVQLADDGSWIFPDISLQQGNNHLSIEATDLDGNVTEQGVDVFHDALWFENPVSIQALSDTQVLVLDNATDSLYEINPATGVQRIVSGPGTAGGVPMRHARDMAINPVSNEAYVLNAGPQINGVIAIDLASGDRRILTNSNAQSASALEDVGTGANWNGELTAISYSSAAGDAFNGSIFAAAGSTLYSINIATGNRTSVFDYSGNIIDIEAGLFSVGSDSSEEFRIVLIRETTDGRVISTHESSGNQRSMANTDGKWLARMSNSKVMVRTGNPIEGYRLTQYSVGNLGFALTIAAPEDKDLLSDTVDGLRLPSGDILMIGSDARRVIGFSDTFSYLLPSDIPSLAHETPLSELRAGFNLAYDYRQKMLYMAGTSEEGFLLVQLDPASGDRKVVLNAPEMDGFSLSGDSRYAARDGIVYLANDIGDGPESKNGIYAVHVAACSGKPGESECVRKFFVNGEGIEAGKEPIRGMPTLMAIDGDDLIVVAPGYVMSRENRYEGAILRLGLSNGTLRSHKRFEDIGFASTLQDGRIFASSISNHAVFGFDPLSETPDRSGVLVSQCDDSEAVFSHTCDESERVNPRGYGPAIGSIGSLFAAGDGRLLASLMANVPSPYDGDVAVAPYLRHGLYLIDTVSGDRTFMAGSSPFDGNAHGSANFFSLAVDEHGDRILYYDASREHVRMVTLRSARNPVTGETYHPANEVIVAK